MLTMRKHDDTLVADREPRSRSVYGCREAKLEEGWQLAIEPRPLSQSSTHRVRLGRDSPADRHLLFTVEREGWDNSLSAERNHHQRHDAAPVSSGGRVTGISLAGHAIDDESDDRSHQDEQRSRKENADEPFAEEDRRQTQQHGDDLVDGPDGGLRASVEQGER